MQISVDGYRAGSAEREAARALAAGELPVLTDEQRQTARRLGIPEDDYARSLYAGRQSQARLLEKAERLARVVQEELRRIAPGTRVRDITLRVFQDRFDVTLQSGERSIAVRIGEALADEMLESGSMEGEQRVARILNYALGTQ